MRIISKKEAVFEKIETQLNARSEDAELEVLAGIDCDEIDIANQEDLGEEDPAVTIELIVRWLPDTGEGLVDWFCVRVSGSEIDPPEVEHAGTLIAFNSKDAEPDVNELVEHAVKALNESVEWAEFELEEEEDGE